MSEEEKMVHAINRIGELPDPLLIHILSLLDNMKDAVRIGLLSKRWKHLWTNLDTLVFHCNTKNPSKKKLKRFMVFVDHTLMRCDSPKIKKFCVSGFGIEEKVSPYLTKLLVDKWLKFVLGKNVEIVKLGLEGLNYAIPVCFFSSSSLVRLEINNAGKCTSFVNLESNNGNTFDVRWNKLKSLSLKGVYVLEDVMSKILLGCPVLETLVLDGVRDLKILDIKFPSVRELKVLNLEYVRAIDGIDLDIIAPRVEKLEVSGCCSIGGCNLVSVPSLKSVSLTLNYSVFHHLRSFNWYEETDVDPHGYFKAVWLIMINCLLRPVCSVDELVIGVELLQAISLSKLLDVDSPILDCKYVTLQSPICVHEVPDIVSLLESLPYLLTLVIKMMPWQCHFSTYDTHYCSYTNYMERVFSTLNDTDYLSEQNGKFLCLKNVKINCTEKLYTPNNEDLGS